MFTRSSSILTLMFFKFEKKIVFSASKVNFLQEFQAKTPFLKAAWGASGANLGHLGAILGHLGSSWGRSWRIVGYLSAQKMWFLLCVLQHFRVFDDFKTMFIHFNTIFAPAITIFTHLLRSWAHLLRFGSVLGPSWGASGAILGHLGAILDRS